MYSTGSRCRWKDHGIIRGHFESISNMLDSAQPLSLPPVRECTSTDSFLNVLYLWTRSSAFPPHSKSGAFLTPLRPPPSSSITSPFVLLTFVPRWAQLYSAVEIRNVSRGQLEDPPSANCGLTLDHIRGFHGETGKFPWAN
ncbi:hypothetical protein Y032_0055g2630 [Ancylostoma ceylanicum]|uniref:Uncharacterized protein n=1 Tax=Ancylostoma ceylanicum TaxID=53326 RepID=A0A016U6X2_9BILA|nr:hypothetical protein Y032_0055g2630 [Ancylostoma ceylanicum]